MLKKYVIVNKKIFCWIKNVFSYPMNRIQTKDYKRGTFEINKISLSWFDDKIYILNNGYDGLALGYYSCLWKSVILVIKNVALIFALVRKALLFFVLAKTVDCKNNLNNHKTQKISIGTIIMNTEMRRFVPDHLKTK